VRGAFTAWIVGEVHPDSNATVISMILSGGPSQIPAVKEPVDLMMAKVLVAQPSSDGRGVTH